MQRFHVRDGGFIASDAQPAALGDDEVCVQVEHVCVSPSDLRRSGTHAPGGGLVGKVVSCGSAASAFQDARVLVSTVQACGECERCRRGLASVCVHRVLLGSDRDGGCAEQVVASARWLTRLVGAVDIEGAKAALAAGPALTAYALYCRAGVAPGEIVIVVGSGVTSAILTALAKARGAKLLAFTGDENKDAVTAKLDEEDLRNKPQHIFVCDTAKHVAVLACATPGSIIALVGAEGEIDYADLQARELCVLGLRFPHPDLMPELVAIVAKGELALDSFVQSISIAEANPQMVAQAHASGRCLVLTH